MNTWSTYANEGVYSILLLLVEILYACTLPDAILFFGSSFQTSLAVSQILSSIKTWRFPWYLAIFVCLFGMQGNREILGLSMWVVCVACGYQCHPFSSQFLFKIEYDTFTHRVWCHHPKWQAYIHHTVLHVLPALLYRGIFYIETMFSMKTLDHQPSLHKTQ